MDVSGAKDATGNRQRRRVFRYGCASVLTLVGSVVLCCGLVAWQWPGPGADPARPVLTPRPIAGSAVLVGDGLTVLYSDPDGACRAPSLAVTETSTAVVLALSETDAGLSDCGLFGEPPRPLQVNLATALGSRPLVDQATGMAVPYFDQSRGLRLSADQVVSDSLRLFAQGSIATALPYFGGSGAGVMVQTFVGGDPTYLRTTTARVRIVQVSGGGWHPPPDTVTSPVTVRGHAGLAAAGIIVWAESGLTVAVIGTKPPQSSTEPPFTSNGPPLATGVLLDIAGALLKGGS